MRLRRPNKTSHYEKHFKVVLLAPLNRIIQDTPGITEKMRELKDKGFSYWKIAEIFNSMSIPTKSRKGRWHAKSIHQILNR